MMPAKKLIQRLPAHEPIQRSIGIIAGGLAPARHQVNDLAAAHRCSNLSRVEVLPLGAQW